MKNLLLAGSLICWVTCAAFAQTDLEQARSKYLNRQVVVASPAFRTATATAGGYVILAGAPFIPESYRGQKATIVAVQPKAVQGSPASVNVMGEPINALPTKEVDFVIKFDDGLVAMRSDSLKAIKSWLFLPEEVAAREKKNSVSEESTKKMVGQQVYATALSELFREDATEFSDRTTTRTFPRLVPMTILASKWDKERSCAIVKLSAPGGEHFIGLISVESFGVPNKEVGCNGTDMWKSVPSFLRRNEITAIQNSRVVIGMSATALYFSIGHPDRENDYGRGGKQLIYKNGLFIYTDVNDIVTNWQQVAH